ncbi:MAG: dihydrodipicolinate synthase family protein, partial [Planctomycetota bacterium]
GIKNGKGNILDNLNYQRLISPDFRVFCTAALLVPGMIYGLSGTISPPMASFPELGVEFVKAIETGNYIKSIEIHKKIMDLALAIRKYDKKVGRGIQLECIRLRGLKIKRYPRWSTQTLNQDERDELKAAYQTAGIPVG